MTARSLFNIILKIIGLFFLRDFIVALPQLLSTISMVINFDGTGGLSALVAIFLSYAVYVILGYVLIFKTNIIIEKLKLDRDFSEEIFAFKIHRSTIFHLAVIIMAGLLILDAVPLLIREIFGYLRYLSFKNDLFETYPMPDLTIMTVYIAQILIALLMIGYQRKIVSYIELKNRNR